MQANKAVKKAVATAKARAMNVLYEELEKKIYIYIYIYISRIAKARDKMTKDFTKSNQIKDEQRVVLRTLDRIMRRWKGCFDKLLNEANHWYVFEDGVSNDGLPHGISRNEVRVTLSGTKKGKTTRMYGIPVEVWMCLGEDGIDML